MFSKNIYIYMYAGALSLATLFLFQGCATHNRSYDNVFCYNESNGITSLDPAFSRDLEVMWATNQLFDGLVELDSAMNPIPCIAKSWRISENGLHYQFIIRQNVLFHPSPLFADSAGRQVV
ncbi:MAG: ABC transporter substrate-binding protein, partial [Flavobacteriales bacterium]